MRQSVEPEHRHVDERVDVSPTEDTVAQTHAVPGATKPRDLARELEAGEHIGRYVVIRKLGAGAMGVVYAAYDPKLDRKVALKLLAKLEAEGTGLARQRLAREAQALAQLAHPNVVGVHDVDVHDDRLFVAMEFVAGRTLGTWMHEQPRPWRTVLAKFIEAGRGLAAAHAAGLIHRDFKPDNAMLGDDGRVRVMDFGLARPEHALPKVDEVRAGASERLEAQSLEASMTHTGTMLGTPAYMALEQFEGHADARSDQFGFCVALYEALYGKRPFAADTLAKLLATLSSGKIEPAPRGSTVPTWLRAVIVRGLAIAPEQRWPSMDALLEALADDPALRRRRWAAAALGVALVAGMAGGALWAVDQRAQACMGFEDKLAGVWDAETKARAEAAFVATDLVYAKDSFRGAAPRLDDYRHEWLAARREACEASQRGEQSGDLLDLRMACLDERLQHVAATVELFEAPDASIVRKAVEAVAGLPPIERCADIDALKAAQPPPEDPGVAARVAKLDAQLIEANALARAGAYDQGLKLASSVVAEAEDLDYEPLRVRAWLTQGELQSSTGAYQEAEATLERAYTSALSLTMVPEAADAARQLVVVVGSRLARHEEGRRWAKHAEPLARATGTPEAEMDYLHNLGTVAVNEGKYEDARASFERTLVIREQTLGPDHPDVAGSLNNLGVVARALGKYEDARTYQARALAIRERALGPDHPDVASSLNNLGAVAVNEGKYEDARAYFERALAIRERALSPEHPDVAATLNNLGAVALHEGKYEDARRYQARALAIKEKTLGPDHPEVAASLNNLGAVAVSEGKYEDARADFERALAIWERALGPDHPEVASCLDNLGAVAMNEGKHEDARAFHQRALAIREASLGPDHPLLAHPLTSLGDVLLSLGAPTEALVHLERALDLRNAHEGDPLGVAETRFALARALWEAPADAGRERARARSLAELAAASYQAAGEDASVNLTRVRAWLASH